MRWHCWNNTKADQAIKYLTPTVFNDFTPKLTTTKWWCERNVCHLNRNWIVVTVVADLVDGGRYWKLLSYNLSAVPDDDDDDYDRGGCRDKDK